MPAQPDHDKPCDMSNEEYIQHVRLKCYLTIQNTSAGVYIQELINRLIQSEGRVRELVASAPIGEHESTPTEPRQ